MSDAKLIKFKDGECDYALCMSKEETTLVLYYLLGNATTLITVDHLMLCNPELREMDARHHCEGLIALFDSIKKFNNIYINEIADEEPE